MTIYASAPIVAAPADATALPSSSRADGISPLSDAHMVLRVVLGSVLVSLLWKFRVFVVGYTIYETVTLSHPLFPGWLQSNRVVAAAYLVSVGACLAALISRDARALRLQLFAMNSTLAILCLHQNSYNDVTFLTCWWTSLWGSWVTWRLGREPSATIVAKGAVLARAILSLMFLGAAMGKLTSEYWSGQVLYEIYFVDRHYWIFDWLRNHSDPITLRRIATAYSWVVIGTESACAFLWILPPAWASTVAIVVLSSIALLSNTMLFSVLSCLLGLALVGLHRPVQACHTDERFC